MHINKELEYIPSEKYLKRLTREELRNVNLNKIEYRAERDLRHVIFHFSNGASCP